MFRFRLRECKLCLQVSHAAGVQSQYNITYKNLNPTCLCLADYNGIISSMPRTVSKLHSSAGKAEILSTAALCLSISSFAILCTSSGECVHDGAAWGGVREAMAELLVDEMGENNLDKVDCDRCRTCAGAIQARGVTCSWQRVHPKPKPIDLWARVARPAAARAPIPSAVRRPIIVFPTGVDTLEPARRSWLIPNTSRRLWFR